MISKKLKLIAAGMMTASLMLGYTNTYKVSASTLIPKIQWIKNASNANIFSYNSVKQTKDGGYIAVGSSFSSNMNSMECDIVKFDAKGNKQWVKTIGGGTLVLCTSVQQTSDGGYIIAGLSDSKTGDFKGINKGSIDAIMIKFDANGNKQWVRAIGGTQDDAFTSVQQTSDGGYIAAGLTNSKDGDLKGLNKGNDDNLIVKLDAKGNKQWVKTIGGTGDEDLNSVQQTSDGGYILAGETSSKDGDFKGINKGNADAVAVKLDAKGNKQWVKAIGGTGIETFSSVQQTKDGGYIAAGYSSSKDGDLKGLSKGNNDSIIVKFDSKGNKQWVKTVGGTDSDKFYSVQQTKDGGYIAAGESSSKDGDFKGINKGKKDGTVVKFDANGNKQWFKNIGGEDDDMFMSIQQTSDNGYVISGSAISKGGDLNGVNTAIVNFGVIIKLY